MTKKIKVLIVTNVRAGGGTEKHVLDIAKALDYVDISYLCDGFWKLYRRISNGNYDIVHFFLPRSYILGTAACVLASHAGATIMSRRSLRSCYQTPLIRWIEERLHKRTTVLVANSPAVFCELAAEAPKNAEMRLIRNGVVGDNIRGPHSRRFVILCIGNAFPYKGHEDLIAAIARVGPSLPEPWVMVFIGKGTEKYKGWRIVGEGYQPRTSMWMSTADIFVLPSHEEGCSNALLEAMAAGVPVIATNVGGNTDAVISGKTGLLVPPKSLPHLVAAIHTLAHQPEMRTELAAAARAYVAKKFSMERCIDEYEALYRSAA